MEIRVLGRPIGLAALAANLIPFAGVIVFGWRAGELVFLYWLENVIIGVMTVARLLTIGAAAGGARLPLAIVSSGLFLLHFGAFCAVHGLLLVAVFAPFGLAGAGALATFPAVLATQPVLVASLLAFAGWEAMQLTRLAAGGRAAGADIQSETNAPYARIVVLHVALLAAGFALTSLGDPLIGLLAIVVAKAGFEAVFASRGLAAPLTRG